MGFYGVLRGFLIINGSYNIDNGNYLFFQW